VSSEFMFDDQSGVEFVGQDGQQDPNLNKRTNLLKVLMATVVAQNAGAFSLSPDQTTVSLAICVEKAIEVLEAEVGTPNPDEIAAIASQMAQLAIERPA